MKKAKTCRFGVWGWPMVNLVADIFFTVPIRQIFGIAILGAALTGSNFALGGEIHALAEKDDLEKVKALLKTDPGLVNSRNDEDNYWTPLIMAARENSKRVAVFLLANKAEVSAKDNEGMTALHWAALYGSTDVAEVLLKNGAKVNAKDKLGMTPLHRAAVNDFPDVAKLLLANKAAVNAKDKDGLTPLNIAAMRDSEGVLRLLRGQKPEVNLLAAVALGDLERIQVLLKDKPDQISKKGLNDWTLLHHAVQHGHKNVAEWLLANGANVNAEDNINMTPLHLAAERADTNMAILLLAKGADVNAGVGANGTPLHEAAMVGSVEMAKLLLAHDTDINARASGGTTPLYEAAVHGQPQIVALLLAHNADINAKKNYGETPLMGAVDQYTSELATANDPTLPRDASKALHFSNATGCKSTAELLLNAKAEVTVFTLVRLGDVARIQALIVADPELVSRKDENGWPLLNEAVRAGHMDIVKLLLNHKAEVNVPDGGGRTPLHWAARIGRADLVLVLLANQADLNVRNNDDQTPLQEAKQMLAEELVAANDATVADDSYHEGHIIIASRLKAVVDLLQNKIPRSEFKLAKLGQLNGDAGTNESAVVSVFPEANTSKAFVPDLGGNHSAPVATNVVVSNAFNLRLVFPRAQPLTTNGLNFSLESSPGLSGYIQVSTNLMTWETLTSFTATNPIMHFCDPGATHSRLRFYRAIVQ